MLPEHRNCVHNAQQNDVLQSNCCNTCPLLPLITSNGLQAEVPETENDLEAIVYFTRTDNLRQKLLYLQCVQAVASAADYHDAVDTLVPLLEDLGRDEDQSEEVRLEVAVQLAALGTLSFLLPTTCIFLLK